MPRCRQLIFAATVVIALIAGRDASGAETDQFVAWGVELDDSAAAINGFLNQEFEHTITRLNRKRPDRPCEAIPGRLYRRVFASLVDSRLRRFMQKSPEVHWYPARDVGYWEYRSRSILRKKAFPVIVPMARTLRIGEVYLGADKLMHVFGIGRRYHVRYQNVRRSGRSLQEVLRKVIRWGLTNERIFLGGLADGVISHADLEANFQGLRLAREMCEGDAPYLEHTDAGWRFGRPVDLRDYVNPGFDESYNPNDYLAYRWRLVRPVLEKEVCPRLESEEVQRRLAHYRKIDPGSISREVIAEYYAESKRRSRHHTLEEVCAAAEERREQLSKLDRSGRRRASLRPRASTWSPTPWSTRSSAAP